MVGVWRILPQRSLDCTFEDATAENLDTFLDALFELHAARWQQRGMPGMLADDVIQRFHREVARAFAELGQRERAVAWANSERDIDLHALPR